MASKYDANDFRNAASYVETYDVFEEHDREIAAMLRQSADMCERIDEVKKVIGDELKKQEHCRKCEWRGKSIRSESACPCDEDVHGVVFDIGVTDRIVKALRGDLEREEREKKCQYQYAARYLYPSGVIATDHIFDNPTDAKHFSDSRDGAKKIICRREVGEWEEVPNDNN